MCMRPVQAESDTSLWLQLTDSEQDMADCTHVQCGELALGRKLLSEDTLVRPGAWAIPLSLNPWAPHPEREWVWGRPGNLHF